MRRKTSKCNWLAAFSNSIAQGAASGWSAYDNINGKFRASIAIIGGVVAFMVRFKTNWSFQGASIRHHHQEEHFSIQNQEIEVSPTALEQGSAKKFLVAPLFTLIDGTLNFSDHLFTFRQLYQLYFNVNNASFWPLMISSFCLQQLYYMGQELWETLEDLTADKAPPFYKMLFAPIMGGSDDSKAWRRRFRILGSMHHTIFEFTPFIISFPELVNFLATYSWGTAIPSIIGVMILFILVYDTTNFFEGRHLEEHLAENEQNRQPIAIPRWRAVIERKLGFIVALFHGALIAAPNYIVPNKISTSLNLTLPLGLPLGIFSLTSGSIGSWKSEVAEGLQQLDTLIQKPAYELNISLLP